jgi:hypothetical protein
MKSHRLGQIQEDVLLAATFGNAWRTALVARGGPLDPGPDPTPAFIAAGVDASVCRPKSANWATAYYGRRQTPRPLDELGGRASPCRGVQRPIGQRLWTAAEDVGRYLSSRL